MLANRPAAAPVDERWPRDPFAVVTCPALRTSLREVSAEWNPESASGSESQAAFDDALVRLALRLDGAQDRGLLPEGDAPEERHDPRVEIRLLEAIRQDLLAQWGRGALPVDEDRVLSLLHVIEFQVGELRRAGAEDLEARLAEPDAFRLVADVAHDLRSPLTSILFLSEALRNGHSGSLSELQQRQLGLVYSAALGLTGVVNDLMTAAQEQTSSALEDAIAFSLAQAFEAVQEMVVPMAEAKQIAIRFGIECFDHRIGHPGPLGRVLLNLTTNAIKFTPEGGSVEVLAQPMARDAVEFSVRDTGRGITPEQVANLFRPFQKSHGRQGFFFAPSGLGLSIVRRLLEKMDAELSVESKLGEGTRLSFVLDLPTTT
jgi:signal transduction histidine kinase